MRLLTPAEISQIEAKAQAMQVLRNENCINIGVNLIDLLNLSPKHGLILIQGNPDTGFEHIRLRHEIYSGKTYWKNDESHTVSLAYPSKFSPKSIPIWDYTALADALYDEAFLNTTDNKEPDKFDLYIGKPPIDLAENRKYKLVLYKNTKIIHTLFPTNDKYTAKKPVGFVFHKGSVNIEEELMSGTVTVSIPYFNHLQEKCYTVVITYRPDERKRYMKIVMHRTNKADLKCDFEDEPTEGKIEGGGLLAMQYQVAELKYIEQLIAKIESDKNNWIQLP